MIASMLVCSSTESALSLSSPSSRHLRSRSAVAPIRPVAAAATCGIGTKRPSLAAIRLRQRSRRPASSTSTSALGENAGDLFLLSTHASNAVVAGDLAEGLEEPVQALYLVFLLGFLVVGAYLVVRQVLIRRELEEAAKVLGERIRTKTATPEDSFELGVILLRKKLYTSALKNLERARGTWDGAPADLAQVHNAIGYAQFQLNKLDAAVENYEAAVALQPGYVTAWNNLGDAREKRGEWSLAAKAYESTLALDPSNAVARARAEAVRAKASASSS